MRREEFDRGSMRPQRLIAARKDTDYPRLRRSGGTIKLSFDCDGQIARYVESQHSTREACIVLRRPAIANSIKDVMRMTTGFTGTVFSGQPERFIIFTNGRTGSNLLVSLLRAHPDIRVQSEIFGEYQLEDRLNRHLIKIRGSCAHFRNAFRPLALERMVGLKILYYQISKEYGEKRGVPDVASVRSEIEGDTKLKFLHLKRGNRMARIISNRLAVASGNWQYGAYLEQPIEIDVAWARQELESMVAWESAFDTWLPRERTLNMSYEELSGDKETVMRSVFDFLGARQVRVTSDLRKQATRPHHEVISNFEELRSVLLPLEKQLTGCN